MALTISTLGTSVLSRQAERAVVALDVSSSGPTQSNVSQEVNSTSNRLQSILQALAPKIGSGETIPDAASDTAVTHWRMSSLSTGSYIPWDRQKEEERKCTYTARTSFEITFRDFSKLGQVVSDMANLPHVSIRNIAWRLTDTTKGQLGQLSRKEAVKDAIAKARDYGDVLEKKRIRAVEVNDVDLGGDPRSTGTLFGSSMQQNESLHFTPQSCEVQCSVKVQFEAE
jgi:uncharacterized protein YggE